MNGRHLYLISFGAVVGIITYYDITKCKKLPWPPRLIFAGLVFLLLDIFAFFSEELAGVVAIGTVIAFVLKGGFVSDCGGIEQGTEQPATYTYLGQGDQSIDPVSGTTNVGVGPNAFNPNTGVPAFAQGNQ